jgi:hypothetical protein
MYIYLVSLFVVDVSFFQNVIQQSDGRRLSIQKLIFYYEYMCTNLLQMGIFFFFDLK